MVRTIPCVCKPPGMDYFSLLGKKKQMNVVWFVAQGSSGDYFCKGIGMPKHHGAFLILSCRFPDLW